MPLCRVGHAARRWHRAPDFVRSAARFVAARRLIRFTRRHRRDCRCCRRRGHLRPQCVLLPRRLWLRRRRTRAAGRSAARCVVRAERRWRRTKCSVRPAGRRSRALLASQTWPLLLRRRRWGWRPLLEDPVTRHPSGGRDVWGCAPNLRQPPRTRARGGPWVVTDSRHWPRGRWLRPMMTWTARSVALSFPRPSWTVGRACACVALASLSRGAWAVLLQRFSLRVPRMTAAPLCVWPPASPHQGGATSKSDGALRTRDDRPAAATVHENETGRMSTYTFACAHTRRTTTGPCSLRLVVAPQQSKVVLAPPRIQQFAQSRLVGPRRPAPTQKRVKDHDTARVRRSRTR